MSDIGVLQKHPAIVKAASCSPEIYAIIEKTDRSTKWIVDLAREITRADS